MSPLEITKRWAKCLSYDEHASAALAITMPPQLPALVYSFRGVYENLRASGMSHDNALAVTRKLRDQWTAKTAPWFLDDMWVPTHNTAGRLGLGIRGSTQFANLWWYDPAGNTKLPETAITLIVPVR